MLITLLPADEHIRNQSKIANLIDFNEVFELVKFTVSKKFDLHRAGLSLILQVMPSNLGAYHILGSNIIVLNKFVLEIIKQLSKSSEDYNSYLYMVLAHEYLHSFGITDENAVRQMTYDLCRSLFGESHISTLMARDDPSSIFPQLKNMTNHAFNKHFEIIQNFDKSSFSYIQ
ncbi:MAG TPA: hypothetical protein VE573_03335 [Nitrososphaeraceae archaeon]|jgi:hypothetical protein|nr:hypothetical protein [Nitrososphaeraceae archaeon]